MLQPRDLPPGSGLRLPCRGPGTTSARKPCGWTSASGCTGTCSLHPRPASGASYDMIFYTIRQCDYYTVPHHTVPYHAMPYHIIPYHTIPYHIYKTYDTNDIYNQATLRDLSQNTLQTSKVACICFCTLS